MHRVEELEGEVRMHLEVTARLKFKTEGLEAREKELKGEVERLRGVDEEVRRLEGLQVGLEEARTREGMWRDSATKMEVMNGIAEGRANEAERAVSVEREGRLEVLER